ncbi:MAG: HDIG domain-containing protein [Planctomyces sp.]|nr:HDIG domain-containing protein [Planctomyces sp.]
MSFFGTRRSRQARVFRPNPTLKDRLQSAVRDYRVLTQIGIGTLAVVLFLLAGQSWRSRFTHRAGDLATEGIQARVDFQVENPMETLRLRLDAEEAAPIVLVQDDTVNDRLQSQLRDHLSDVANAESANQVTQATRIAFGLDTGDEQARQATFTTLKKALFDDAESAGSRIDALMLQYGELMANSRILGVLDANTAQRMLASNAAGRQKTLNRNQAIKVVRPSGDAIHYGVLADVLLQEQLRETGRLGKTWPKLPELQEIRNPVELWLTNNLKNQLKLDPTATEDELRMASEGAPPKFDTYAKGEILVAAGTQIASAREQQGQLGLLWEEYEAHEASVSWSQRAVRLSGTALMLVVMVVLFGAFLRNYSPELIENVPRLLTFVLMCAMTVFLSCMASRDPWRAEIVPLMAAVLITTIAFNQVVAILTAFCLCLIVSMGTVTDLSHFVILITITLASVIPARRIRSRLTLIRGGFYLSLVAFFAVWSVSVIQAHDMVGAWRNPMVILSALKFAGWTIICCFLVAGSLPFIEKIFDVVTDISLLELTAVSHPLLQELARRAPGTYNHSMTVAAIGEAAAESIGANGLLTRVGAYFHDIGKMMKPEYFIENMTEGSENHHKSLAPAMSTLIIIGHVKEGLELAEENNLPESLVQFIEQHHGTTLVEYFYHEATRKADEDHRTDADESSFRYPGPKPQCRETAVLMLADAVESASRTLKEPTPKRIQSLVHEITMKRLLDGQFDECDLKMAEIRMIEESLIKSLLAAHHGRVKYPDQRTA